MNDVIEETREFWEMPNKGVFHNAVSAIVGQRIKFIEARKIRSKLYQLLGDPYSPEKLLACKVLPVNDANQSLLRQVAENHDIEFLKTLRGIGPWTIKSIQIMSHLNDNIFLFEDFWIRSRMEELFGKRLTPSSAEKLGNKFLNKSDASRFFWRIKKQGIQKVRNEEKLTREDFV